jgi:thiol-disulfide isomerase/thioredoxin
MKKEIGIIIAALVIILAGAYFLNKPVNSGKYDALATCIKDSGATFYGAFWCPHCKAQKALFGDSVKYLPYVECSLPDGQSQTPICIQKGIQSYPTWVFKNGDRLSGEVSLADLAAKTSCTLPAGDSTATSSAVTATSTGTATVVTPQTGTAVQGGATSTSNGLPNGTL